jgi:hypothetical protein
MKVLLSRLVVSIVLVHDRARNKPNTVSERTSPVTCASNCDDGRVTSVCPTIGLCDRARCCYRPVAVSTRRAISVTSF